MSQTESPAIRVEKRPHSYSRFAIAVAVLALAVALFAAMSGLGSRWGLWHFRTGFSMLRWAAYGAIAVGVLSLGALYRTRPGGPRRGFGFALFAVVVAITALVIPWQWQRTTGTVPRIHDITTDTDNPPAFVAIVPLRADASNPVEYAGPEAAQLQREAYPDLRPIVLDLPPDAAFERALGAARGMGWRIVDANIGDRRIEATDRTFWFGFHDDVVIRITPSGTRSIVDVRSKSRVGRSDVGTNARRIRAYMDRLGT